MTILNKVLDFMFPLYEDDTEEDNTTRSQGEGTLVYAYAMKYINSLDPTLIYDVTETLKSGRVITHLVGVPHAQARDYVSRIWITACPPNINMEVSYE